MRFIIAKIKQYLFPLLLVFVALFVIFKSYTPGTILSGWDTLHPEFNFGLYFKRIFTVWQSHQGLGAPPSQSHIGDFPHAFILWIMSFILPMNLLRYVYILSMLIIGPLGAYFFLKYYIFNKNEHSQIYAFIGGLFYLLNLGTLQNFYTPLEMFTVLYGFIGWFFWTTLRYLENNNKKNLFTVFIISILLTPASHTATLWYVFYLSFGLFLFTNLISHKFQKNLLIKSIFIFIFIFLINAFWILPNLYYAKNYGKDVSLSKINRMGSNEFFLHGQKRGTVKDLALITNFPFDWKVYDFDKDTSIPQMDQWEAHIQTPFVMIWGAILFLLFLTGIILAFIKKNYLLMALSPVVFLCFIFLRNANLPFTTIFIFLRDKSTFFRELFRFPFTKFSIIYIFLYSVFLSYAFSNLINFLSKRIPKGIYIHFFTALFIGQIFFMLPLFKTGYISKIVKVKIPENYFNLFSYLKLNPSQRRILSLPLHNYSGWQYNNWGYQGAGFLWFGIDQPLLNREFDRWYPYNEQAYREFSYALYSRDVAFFSKTLKKYQIGYLLLDESIVDTDVKDSRQITFNRETKELLDQIPYIQTDWKTDFLTLYKVSNEQDEVELISNLQSISPSYRIASEDVAYNNFGDYISTDNEADIYYPFRSFLNETDKLSSNLTFDLDDYYFKADMGVVPEGKQVLPILKPDDNFASQGGSLNISKTSVYGKIPKQGFTIKPNDIEKISLEQEIDWKKETSAEKIRYESTDKIISSFYDLSSLSQDLAYVISFKTRNISGLPLRICLKSLYSKRCEIYDELSKNKDWIKDIFVLPPTHQGLGYTLEISNISFGSISAINELSSVKIVPFPYSFLKEIRIEKPGFERKVEQKIPLNFTDFGFVKFINLPLNTPDGAIVILNQAFEKNWKALANGKEIKDHIKINNWANGWTLRPVGASESQGADQKITIIFWPQYLEFIGFAFLVTALLLILL